VQFPFVEPLAVTQPPYVLDESFEGVNELPLLDVGVERDADDPEVRSRVRDANEWRARESIGLGGDLARDRRLTLPQTGLQRAPGLGGIGIDSRDVRQDLVKRVGVRRAERIPDRLALEDSPRERILVVIARLVPGDRRLPQPVVLNVVVDVSLRVTQADGSRPRGR
jgi:hypothetical protein